MKLIPLTKGQFAQVDDEDFDYLNQFKWYATNSRGAWYAIRVGILNGKKCRIAMHRTILNTPIGMLVDHKDHNGLNNQRSNIRNCNYAQNCMNTSPRGRSKYLGVSIDRRVFRAQIWCNRKIYRLGSYKIEEDAARAYDAKAKELFGEFANLNFK